MQEPITIYSNKKIYLSLFIFCFLFLKHFGVFKMISIIFIILAAYALYRLYKTSPVVIQMTEEGFRKKDSTFVNWDSIIQLNIRKIWWLKYIEYVTKDGTKVLTFLGTGVSAGYIYNIMRKHLV